MKQQNWIANIKRNTCEVNNYRALLCKTNHFLVDNEVLFIILNTLTIYFWYETVNCLVYLTEHRLYTVRTKSQRELVAVIFHCPSFWISRNLGSHITVIDCRNRKIIKIYTKPVHISLHTFSLFIQWTFLSYR